MSSLRPFLLEWSALLALATLACGPSAGPPIAIADAGPPRTDGETRCLGTEFQVCRDRVFETEHFCPDGCSVGVGCREAYDECKANDDGDVVATCSDQAPPESFEPEVQWSWTGVGTDTQVFSTPLVANMTDDNGDGVIDLCDVPDVVVVAAAGCCQRQVGHIYVLDGETGELQIRFEQPVDSATGAALGDIDGDGIPEIVSVTPNFELIALEHDGTVKWTSPQPNPASSVWYGDAIALADLDNDGDVEIIASHFVADHLGNILWTAPRSPSQYTATTAADLDGDEDLEVILGNAAYHHTGELYYAQPGILDGFPQVANLDGDPDPEVLVTNANGISLLNHDGTIVYQDMRPTGTPAGGLHWLRPAAIHDFNGDGIAEFALSSQSQFAVYDAAATVMWQADVYDGTGIAGGTAFDFLGDGTAEAMYADETTMSIFDIEGNSLLSTLRSSVTIIEYPVVADIDNDGSAEIVVVSNNGFGGGSPSPAVQVIRDVEDRWIQARRIWNQHTYHVTNVREDGTIPKFEPASWRHLNTFRTNAQIENGSACDPIIE